MNIYILELRYRPVLSLVLAPSVTSEDDLAVRAAVSHHQVAAAEQRTAETDGSDDPLQDAFVVGNPWRAVR